MHHHPDNEAHPMETVDSKSKSFETFKDQLASGSAAEPVIELFSQVVLQCITHKAQMIVVEPTADKFEICLEIDGQLKTLITPPLDMKSSFASRVKIVSNLDLFPSRVDKNGEFSVVIEDEGEFRFEVCVSPTEVGERVTIRKNVVQK
jgi:type IV pilus assembly protein PilB